jgi:glycine/D-amino acid oxidase-like deaminating enzyme
LLPELNIKPGRGQVIATKPIKGLKLKGIFHYDEGYYYFRNFGERIIFGGGRNLDFDTEATTEFELNQGIIDDLLAKLREMIIPDIDFEVEDKWTGIMGFTENKLPLIKKLSDNVTAAISCNGMGVALSSFIANELVKDLM